MPKREKAYCAIVSPKLFSTIKEAINSVGDEVKLDHVVICTALGTTEVNYKIRKGVFPFGITRTIPKDVPEEVKGYEPTAEQEGPKPEPTDKPEKIVEPCTFCPKPGTFIAFDADKKPFKVCKEHKVYATEKLK